MIYIEIDKKKGAIVRVSSVPLKPADNTIVVTFEQNVPADRLTVRWVDDEPIIEVVEPPRRDTRKLKKQLEELTEKYILRVLSARDWGDTYVECIAELASSAIDGDTEAKELIAWVESVWRKEEELERQIDTGDFDMRLLFTDEDNFEEINPFPAPPQK